MQIVASITKDFFYRGIEPQVEGKEGGMDIKGGRETGPQKKTLKINCMARGRQHVDSMTDLA